MDFGDLLKLAQSPQVRNLVTSLFNQFTKGGDKPNVNSLMSNLESAGAGDQVKSWVGTGDNKPISPEQITQAFGADHIAQAAKDAGCTPEEAASELSKVLPAVVDNATPNGQPPQTAEFDQMFARLFGGDGPSAATK